MVVLVPVEADLSGIGRVCRTVNAARAALGPHTSSDSSITSVHHSAPDKGPFKRPGGESDLLRRRAPPKRRIQVARTRAHAHKPVAFAGAACSSKMLRAICSNAQRGSASDGTQNVSPKEGGCGIAGMRRVRPLGQWAVVGGCAPALVRVRDCRSSAQNPPKAVLLRNTPCCLSCCGQRTRLCSP